MRRTFGIAFACLLVFLLLYVSHYWEYRLWDRDGLAGIAYLRPQGDLVGQATRGTPLAPFDILVWAVGGFLVLTCLQAIWSRIFKS